MATPKEQIALAERLTRIEAGQTLLSKQIELNHANLQLQLSPILDLQTTVTSHDRDISRWKGVNAALGFIIAIVAAVFGKLKLWHL